MDDSAENGSGTASDEPVGPRPEEMLEAWGRRAGKFLAAAAARAREEAEDIWAEAQSVRRGERD